MCWPSAAFNPFLSDRVALYEMCEAVRAFPGLVSVTHYWKIDQVYSDSVCAEIEKGLAQYVRWYEARSEQQRKIGKHRYESKYKTLNELLGVTEELRRGGWNSGRELTEVSSDYKDACIAAAMAGLPMPDVNDWLVSQADDE
jgi:hypothetical protein